MTENNNHIDLLTKGTILHGTYRIESYLASGGFGNTYEAINVQLGEHFAIKEFFLKGIVQRDSNNKTISISNQANKALFLAQKEKFKAEAKLIRKLNNKHIVKLYDLFEENGTAYYVMEYLEGKSIANILKETGTPMNEYTAIDYVSQVLDALKEVFSHRFFHLDIKPSNIIVSNGCAVLIDFGSSKQMKEDGGATSSMPLSFTSGYAPSELMDGDIKKFGPWTDFYSLGATLYNMVSMQNPPAISDISEDGKDAFEFPYSVSEVTKDLIYWMMNVGRSKRPQSVDDINEYISNNYNEVFTHRSEPDNKKVNKKATYEDSDNSILEGSKLTNETNDNDEETIVSEVSNKEKEITNEEPYTSTEDEVLTHPAKQRKWRKAIAYISTPLIGIIAILCGWLHESKTIDSSSNEYTEHVDSITNAVRKLVIQHVKNKKYKDAKGNSFTYSGGLDKNGKPFGEGHGEYSYGIYDGVYKNGLKDGNGKFVEKSGNTFEGTFSNDFYAKGKYIWKNANRIYTGTFYNEGQFYNGTWRNRSTGKITSKMINGQQKEVR